MRCCTELTADLVRHYNCHGLEQHWENKLSDQYPEMPKHKQRAMQNIPIPLAFWLTTYSLFTPTSIMRCKLQSPT
ncbi:Uncharacterised protein [Vibrio cholerae]|nr:Uncharacterised protein [Vibrio cholerae]